MRTRTWCGVTVALFAVLMAVGLFAPTQAWAEGKDVGFYKWNGSTWVWETQHAEILDDIDSDHYTLSDGWYVITGDWGDGDRPTISGTVNIIIENGCDVHLRNGIRVPERSTLNIYGQSGNTGKLKVAKSKADTAAIGGDSGENSGTINIYGGDLNVHGGSKTNHGGAGIGGGWKGSGTVNIYGGNIVAEGGNEGAGIGGGSNKEGDADTGGGSNNIKIYGGTVKAEGYWSAGIGGGMYGRGGNIEIYGGDVTATGGADGAGIGGGFQKDGGNITISGGSVTAKGGSLTSNGGAGIGGGGKGSSGTIRISGGTVKASGGAFAAGIGGGDEGEGNDITIEGGNVTAIGHTQDSNGGGGAAGIGGGDKAHGKYITISGGTVSATGGTKLSVKGGAGIGGGSEHNGENITISGSANITKAQGGTDAAGIGGGDLGEGKNITISGGTVNAHGGSEKDGGGAGIGGGQKKTGEVTISGGTITATGGGDGAGIGGGEDGSANVQISDGTVTANGGRYGAGIGGGQDGEGGTITITGGNVKALGGEEAAGIGGGQDAKSAGTIAIGGSARVDAEGGTGGAGVGGGRTGGRAGSILIEGSARVKGQGHIGAGIGSGEWSTNHSSGGDYYATAVSVTIQGNPTVYAYGTAGGAGIGGGRYGISGAITIKSGTVRAYGGNDGGAGIGAGSGCEHSGDGITTVVITIDGGDVLAKAGHMTDTLDEVNSDPGAAIGTGGTERGTINEYSYFTGHIYLNGGHIRAYSADITKRQTVKEESRNVIGTTSPDNRDWEKGVVHFGGATVDMYPGEGSGGSIKQMVRASDTSEGGIVLAEKDTSYQRVTFTTQNDNIGTMREAKLDYRTLVLTGAEEIEEYEGTKLEDAKYKHIRVEPAHKHHFTYSVGTTYTTGDTIIATCSGGNDCELSNHQARLILTKPPHEVYGDGKDAGVVVTDVDHIGDAKVAYYQANYDGTKASALDENNLYEIPTDAGHYWAEITLDGEDPDDATQGTNKATAHVVYTIAKATPTVIPTAVIDEGPHPSTIDLAANVMNTPKEGLVTYTLDDSDTLYNEGIKMEGSVLRIPEASTTGGGRNTVTVHVYYAGDNNYSPMNSSIVVTINRQPRPTITPDEVTFRYGETGKSVGAQASGDAGETGAITYAVKSTASEYDIYGDGTTGSTSGGTGGATGADSEWSENDIIRVSKTTGALEAKKNGTTYVTVTVAGNEHYAPTTKDVKVTVRGAEFSGVTVAGYEGVYDGYSHGVTVSGVPENIGAKVYLSTTELTDANYQIEGVASDDSENIDFVQFKDASEHTVYYYVTAPNYEPMAGSANVKISKKPIEATVSAENKEYDGTASATVTATVNSADLIEGDSVEIGGLIGSFASKNVGENKPVAIDTSAATFSGEGADNYEVTIPTSTTATINKAFVIVFADDVYVPVGTQLPDEYTATSRTPAEGEEIDVRLTCDADITKPGRYEIVVTADPDTETNRNYDIWCIDGTLTVTRPIEVTATGFNGTYDGQPHSITVDVQTPGISLPNITDADINNLTREQLIKLAEWAEWAGFDIIMPEGEWALDDDVWSLWELEAKAELKEAIANLKLTEVYYSTEEFDDYNFDEDDTINPTFTDAGTYTVYYYVEAFDGQATYGSADVVIEKASPEFTAPTSKAITYTGSPQEILNPGTVTGGKMEYSLDGVEWSESVPTKTDVGTYAVLYRITGDKNYYDIAPTGVVGTIAKSPEPEVVLESWTYGSPAKTPMFTDGVNSITQGVTFSYKEEGDWDWTYTSQVPTQAGDYVVRADAKSTGTPYDGTYYAEFSIIPKPVTATLIANDKDYDGTNEATLLASVDDSLVLQGDSISIGVLSGWFEDANAGESKQVYVNPLSVDISGTGSENYEVTIPDYSVATINRVAAFIGVNDVTVAIGQPVPEPFKSLVYVPVKDDELVYSLYCDYEQKVGEYDILVDIDESIEPNCNYDVYWLPGKLTITEADLAVSAEAYAGTYDGQPHGITVTALPEAAQARVYYSAERDLDASNCRFAGTLNNPTFTDAGTHRVYYCVLADNYNPVIGFKDVVIAKAQPTVTAPTGTQLSYTGKSQALVAAGSATGGTMEYSLDGESWSADVPTASEPGTYAVLYRVTGDANHSDSAVKAAVSTIGNGSAAAAKSKEMHRLYNPNSGEHFYTASSSERDHLVAVGWNYEGVGWIAPVEGAPVYRLYNPNAGDHHYTVSVEERNYLVAVGWNDEGVGWNSAGDDGVPLWRQYNPNAVAGAHNYTTSVAERDSLVSAGWQHEGIGWYGLNVEERGSLVAVGL